MKKCFWKFLILPLLFLAAACGAVDPSNPGNNGNPNEPEIAVETPSQGDKYVEFSLINLKSIFDPNQDPNDNQSQVVLKGQLFFTGGNQPEPCCGDRIVRLADFTNQRFVDVRVESQDQGGTEGMIEINILTTSLADLGLYLTSYNFDTNQEGILQDCPNTGCVDPYWNKLAHPLI